MKKTFNINIAGQSFIIDEDAYEMLTSYFNSIASAFNAKEEAEISSDIEARVAELFIEKGLASPGIITIADAEWVISRIGRPEEMVADDVEISAEPADDGCGSPAGRTTPPPPPPVSTGKKFFRDPQDHVLGGVCSGIGWYIGLDAVWVRLIMVAICFLSFSTMAVVYVILWIVVPEAATPYQRLQMMGQSPSVENIGRIVTDEYKPAETEAGATDGQTSSAKGKFGSGLSSTLSVIIKILVILVLVVASPALVGLAIGLAGCIFALIMFETSIPGFQSIQNLMEGSIPDVSLALWTSVGWIVTIGVPLFALVWLCSSSIWPRTMSKSWKISLLATWIAGFILAAFTTGAWIRREGNFDESFEERIERQIEENISRTEKAEEAEEALVKADSALEAADSIIANTR